MGRSKGKMDSISLPDKEKISNLSGGFVNSRRVYRERGIDDFTNSVRADFSEAAPIKVPERTEPEKREEDDFIEKSRAKPMPKSNTDTRYLKLGRRSVPRWRFFKIAAIVLVAIIVLCVFCPPIMLSNSEGTTKRNNIFADKGISAVKEELLKNENVYNIDNMTSEKPENYRVCTLGIQVSNYTPFKSYIGGFSILTCDPLYKDKFVSVSINEPDGYVIPAFSVRTVQVNVLVCVTEMTDQQLTDAMTSLVLKTTGLKKGLGSLPGMPIIPGAIFVSDALEYNLD